jgi:hypothetical protein
MRDYNASKNKLNCFLYGIMDIIYEYLISSKSRLIIVVKGVREDRGGGPGDVGRNSRFYHTVLR